MKGRKYKQVSEICNDIDRIIMGDIKKADYKYPSIDLNYALKNDCNYGDIALVCETVLKMAKTKNRVIRHLEKDFWRFVTEIPFHIGVNEDVDEDVDEEEDEDVDEEEDEDVDEEEDEDVDEEELETLLPNFDYANVSMKIFSRLIGFAEEILALDDDRSKGSDLRRSGAISIVAELLNDYDIPMAKQIFMRSITSKNSMEQYAALEGLEAHFIYTDEDIDDELLATLNKIIHETTEREVASTCLQIQVNAGVIDELTAVFQLGDWKEDHER